MIPTLDALAFAMYERNAKMLSAGAPTTALEKLWADDPDLRKFWEDEARFVLEFLGMDQ